MKPTLLVLAAGMGSRYGSLKQIDGVGPKGEPIIEYSVYDAIRAGFGKVVFVIRHSFAEEFKKTINAERFGGKIEVEYVYQELDYLPNGFTVPEGREKPWGTNHALMMGEQAINEPFAVINADDFYGQNAIETIGKYLTTVAGKQGEYVMIGYEVCKTLSENGTVSRGVCTVDGGGYLSDIVERTTIERQNGRIVFLEGDKKTELDENTPVSMNLFGFTPDYFQNSTEMFKDFLNENSENIKAEFFIPLVVNKMVKEGTAKLKVLPTSSDWFGVTYKEDKPDTVARIAKLVDNGVYPNPLF